MSDQELELLCINTIRTLSIDAVQHAKSGHPGTPMALAPLVYAIWNEVMRFDPQDPRAAAQAKAAGIPITSFSEHRRIDLTIDGADEVERGTLNLIKGRGGALLREKIVAAASHRLAIVVDGSKLVDRLGTHTPVPVEVVAFGLEATQESLEVLGASARARMSSGDFFVTDNGNFILDCDFGAINDPARLEERIKRIVGVAESGLFV